MFTPPCYDTITKTDCPDRKLGCHDTCEKWAKYEKKRNARYRETLIRNSAYTGDAMDKRYISNLERPKVKIGLNKR